MNYYRLFFDEKIDGKFYVVETFVEANSSDEAFRIAKTIDPRFGVCHIVDESEVRRWA